SRKKRTTRAPASRSRSRSGASPPSTKSGARSPRVPSCAACTARPRTSNSPRDGTARTSTLVPRGAPAMRLSIRSAGTASTTSPNFTEVFSGAATIAKGADAIFEDQPQSLADADRLRYEGLVQQLKEKAANLQAAAEQQQAFQARRTFSQLTASCVKCHSQFA